MHLRCNDITLERKVTMNRKLTCLFILTCMIGGNQVTMTVDTSLSKSAFQDAKAEKEIQEQARHIFQEADKLFKLASDRFNKFLHSNHKDDHLTLKDFVWGFKGVSEGMKAHVIYPLEKLRKQVSGDQTLAKALALAYAVTADIHKGIANLCKDLHPYERTKKPTDGYQIARLLKTNVEKFLSKDCFNRYRNNLEEVIKLLSLKPGLEELVKELKLLKMPLDKIGTTATNIDKMKVLNHITNRIRHN